VEGRLPDTSLNNFVGTVVEGRLPVTSLNNFVGTVVEGRLPVTSLRGGGRESNPPDEGRSSQPL
jgi:hypothetical protein